MPAGLAKTFGLSAETPTRNVPLTATSLEPPDMEHGAFELKW